VVSTEENAFARIAAAMRFIASGLGASSNVMWSAPSISPRIGVPRVTAVVTSAAVTTPNLLKTARFVPPESDSASRTIRLLQET
jgi:hypothetical protein